MKKARAATFLMLGMSLFTALPTHVLGASSDTIASGIYIHGIDMGGKTREEAIQLVDDYFQDILEQDLELVCTDRSLAALSLSDWEFTWDAEEVVDKALAYSHSGFLIRSYKNQQNLNYSNLYLDASYTLSTDAIRETLDELSEEHDRFAVNPTVSHVGSNFVITAQSQDGLVTDQEATLYRIQDTISRRIYDRESTALRTEVVTQVEEPSYTSTDIMTIKDNLGTFTTDYSGSSDNRKNNIATAAGYIDGTILLPGESCSTSTVIKDRTEENGYKIAAQYSNGEAEQDVGGGVCQISTTLYNAVIRAELQVDERHNHSMVVHYVKYGEDAAIATDQKDLIFTNNLSNPIYIEAIADGDYLTFSIYGTETRADNRRIEFVAETLEEKWPDASEMNERYSSELPEGQTRITGTNRPQVTATLTKVIYLNDVESERILMHTDYYMSSKKTITHGTKKADTE